MVMDFHTLNDNETAIPSSQMAMPKANVAWARLIWVFSTTHAMVGSTSEMAEVHAAKATSVKIELQLSHHQAYGQRQSAKSEKLIRGQHWALNGWQIQVSR